MDSLSANTSNDDFEPADLPRLAPGESPTPIPRTSRVATKISVTELPIPRILTKPDTAPKREAMRKTEHAMNYHPVDEENDVMAQVDRIKAGMQGNRRQPVHASPQFVAASSEQPETFTFEDAILLASIAAIVVAGGYLLYKAISPGDAVRKVALSSGKRELKLAKAAAEIAISKMKK